MARDQEQLDVEKDAGANGWTLLTNSNVTNVTFQCIGAPILIRYTVGTSEPAAGAGGALYAAPNGELKKALSDLTELSGANRVWARPATATRSRVYVDHA